MPEKRAGKGASRQRQVVPGAGKLVVALAVKVLAEKSPDGLVALLTESSLIIGRPSQSKAIGELLEISFEAAKEAYRERGLEGPILGGGATIELDQAEVRPLSALTSIIKFSSLIVFTDSISAIAPATGYSIP